MIGSERYPYFSESVTEVSSIGNFGPVDPYPPPGFTWRPDESATLDRCNVIGFADDALILVVRLPLEFVTDDVALGVSYIAHSTYTGAVQYGRTEVEPPEPGLWHQSAGGSANIQDYVGICDMVCPGREE